MENTWKTMEQHGKTIEQPVEKKTWKTMETTWNTPKKPIEVHETNLQILRLCFVDLFHCKTKGGIQSSLTTDFVRI